MPGLFKLPKSRRKVPPPVDARNYSARTIAELAAEPSIREALQFFTRERAWINDQHLRICRVPAPTFYEQQRAEYLSKVFTDLGLEAGLDRAGNVLAHRRGETGGAWIALTAHLDTVLAPRVPEEITVTREGRFFGPGVADNGVGLAALVALARVLAQTPPVAGQLAPLLVANVGEEGEGNLSGMRYLCEQSDVAQQIRAFLVLDGPTSDHITAQALASRRFEISVTGVGGHSWSDSGTGNPVHALARALTFFTDHPRTLAGFGARSSFNFGVVEGGANVTSIPTLARAKVDLRSEDPSRLIDMSLLLQSCVERAIEIENDRAIASGVTVRIREIGTRPGGQLPSDAPLLQCLKSVEQHLGIHSVIDVASTDANIPLSMGLAAVSVGAGGQGGGAHTMGEWYQPDGRDLGLKRIYLAMSALMRPQPSGDVA